MALDNVEDVKTGCAVFQKRNNCTWAQRALVFGWERYSELYSRQCVSFQRKMQEMPERSVVTVFIWRSLLFVALPALTLLSKMQDGFGVNIIVGFTQVISVFGRLELNWPKEIIDFMNILSVFNLNLEFFSIDCFVVSWNWTRKFFVVNFGPLVLAACFSWRRSLSRYTIKSFCRTCTRQLVDALSCTRRGYGSHAEQSKHLASGRRGEEEDATSRCRCRQRR